MKSHFSLLKHKSKLFTSNRLRLILSIPCFLTSVAYGRAPNIEHWIMNDHPGAQRYSSLEEAGRAWAARYYSEAPYNQGVVWYEYSHLQQDPPPYDYQYLIIYYYNSTQVNPPVFNQGPGGYEHVVTAYICDSTPNPQNGFPSAFSYSASTYANGCPQKPVEAVKNLGASCPAIRNPINPGTGNKYQIETDFKLSGSASSLAYSRTYNSYGGSSNRTSVYSHDKRWTNTYERSLKVTSLGGASTAYLFREDGRTIWFDYVSGQWLASGDISARLEPLDNGWKLVDQNNDEIYDTSGKLLSITSHHGYTQTLSYSGIDTDYAVDANGVATTRKLPVNLLVRVTDSYGRKLRNL